MNHVMLLLFQNKKPTIGNISVHFSVDLCSMSDDKCNNGIFLLYNITSKKWSRKSVDKLSGETIDYKMLSA